MPNATRASKRPATKRSPRRRSKYADLMGILPDPPELVRMLEEALKDRPATPEARRYMMDEWKLDYYFCGLQVIFIRRPEGREIVGVEEEIPKRLAALSPKDRKQVVYACTRPWLEEIEET